MLRGIRRVILSSSRIGSSFKSLASLAKASWIPSDKEKKALRARNHINRLSQVDEIWNWLESEYGEVIAVDAPHAFHPETLTYRELSELINYVALGFSSLGILRNEVVALFGENSPRWLIADQGLMRIGACDAVRGVSSPVEELHYILEDSKAIAIIIQNKEVWRKLSLSEDSQNKLKCIVQLEGSADKGVMTWDELIQLGKSSQEEGRRSIDQSEKSIPVNTATIIYTSGTTGQPKGVPLSHGNLLHQMKALACVANPLPGSPVLSVLPIWHAYERSAEYYFFSCGCTQSYTTIKYFKEDLLRIRPAVMATVPRLWEAIYLGFQDALSKMSPVRRSLISNALSNSCKFKSSFRKARGLWLSKTSYPSRLIAFFCAVFRWPLHYLSSLLLWPKVVDKLSGGKLLYPINGGGAIAPHVDSFFEGVGIELLVGYGLTETSPVVSCRRPWRNLRGSSGPPLPETEFRVVDPLSGEPMMFRQQGRVLIRGPQVMNGYLRKPEATLKVLDADGWFDTGDLGMLLPDGDLVLTGREKDTIVLSSGENIEPGPLEELLVASPLFDQVMLVGQDQKQLGALLVPRRDLVLNWAKEKGIFLTSEAEVNSRNKELIQILKKEINTLLVNRKGARREERVVGVALVSPFTIENGLLTQTLKQKRKEIVERDQKSIDFIYNR